MPVRVVKVMPSGKDGDGSSATALVDLGGVEKEISIALVDDVQVGDYLILHAGFALSRLDPEEAAQTLALFDELAKEAMTDATPQTPLPQSRT